MEKLLNYNIQEQGVAKNVMVKAGKMLKNVNNVKVKVWSSKCIKWAQVCINKFKNIAINAVEKDKLFHKEVNVKSVMEKKSYKKRRRSMFQLRKELQTIIQSQWPGKVTKFQMLWQVI